MSDTELNQVEQPVEAVTFTQEQLQEAVNKAAAAKDEEYKGVINKNSELLGEKKAAQEKAEEARLEREAALQESLKKSGDVEQLEKSLREQFEKERLEYKGKIDERDKKILGSRQDSVISELSNDFQSPTASKLLLKNLTETSYDESGNTITNFKSVDGTVITTDINEFRKYMRSDDAITPYLKAIDSSGGGGLGSKIISGASDVKNEKKEAARKKGDVTSFLNLSFQEQNK